MLTLLALLAILRGAAGAWETAFISNTQPRTVGAGGPIVGAQDGNLIAVPAAQGGGFALVGMSYGTCLFTACKNTSIGSCGFGAGSIHVWRSKSLGQSDWAPPAEILPAAQRPVGTYFRPHVVYNAATAKWVLWVRWLCCGDGSLSQQHTTYLSATADALVGPYTVALANVTMFWPDSADDNLFVDEADGAAYIVHTARSTGTKIVVERLSADYTRSAGATDPAARSDVIGPGTTEAPALFKVGALYYVSFARLCCYCTEGAATSVYAAPAPLGPYAPLTSLGNAPGGQQNFVFAAPDRLRGVLWAANRWGSDPVHPAAPQFDYSLQYWALLDFDAAGNISALKWEDSFNVSVLA
jgi:hypothetical protein